MPWTLYYNLEAPGEREALQIERDLFERCPDVDSIAVRRQGIPFGDTALDVFFVDELFRTNNEDLIRLALRRSSYPQVPPEVSRTVEQRIIDEFLANPEARSRFAERLIAPIREQRNYTALARAIMPVQQLPPGAMSIYDRDPQVGPGEALREVVPPESFDIRSVRPSDVPAAAHVANIMDNDMRGDATVHSTLASYSRVEGYTLDEPGFFPAPLTRVPMTGLTLINENKVAVSQDEAPRETAWARLLEGTLPDDD